MQKEHLIAKQIEKNGLKESELTFQNGAIEQLIRSYTREAGVRNLERKIGEICRKAAREIYEGKKKESYYKYKELRTLSWQREIYL